ncbi:hypothetical protein AZE42_02811 [Rhizopogon vesiculosus]|uniref:Uncharacterized protein n=1 Tax=Rhizopogon vesiculosus TaxID=180088 RepID=A0A1J8QED2_9AGAM|nr:hypothetical protein AZE42_02811 [Rhizopogon vesiculosus]
MGVLGQVFAVIYIVFDALMAGMGTKNFTADVPHSWATVTDQLNTILTFFYEISDPPILSLLSGIPIPFLQRAITTLTRSNRAQIIGVADGRFFAATK